VDSTLSDVGIEHSLIRHRNVSAVCARLCFPYPAKAAVAPVDSSNAVILWRIALAHFSVDVMKANFLVRVIGAK